MKTRKCYICGQSKTLQDFPKDRTQALGRGYQCRVCDKLEYENYWLRKRYGITMVQYQQMLTLQGGRCAICQTMRPPKHRGLPVRFCVDHDHVTGRVRGLLCHRCNVGLGMYQDSPELLKVACAYLQEYNVPKSAQPLLLKGEDVR